MGIMTRIMTFPIYIDWDMFGMFLMIHQVLTYMVFDELQFASSNIPGLWPASICSNEYGKPSSLWRQFTIFYFVSTRFYPAIIVESDEMESITSPKNAYWNRRNRKIYFKKWPEPITVLDRHSATEVYNDFDI